jgi:SAM-dependent methyltransferase
MPWSWSWLGQNLVMHGFDGQRSALLFDRAAEAYTRARPGYPREAIDWLLPENARTVLDIGAGTGKLTGQLVKRGLEVTAVEPSPRMRAALKEALPGIDVRAGTAEQLPINDLTMDAVLFAQAWHWVDPSVAVPEILRVARRGATLGLVWNIRDRRQGWVAELDRLLGPSDTIEPGEIPTIGPPFGPVQQAEFTTSHALDRSTFLDLIRSRSQVVELGDSERRELLRSVDVLLDSHPDTRDRERVDVPYRTLCFRAVLTDSHPR